jgi:hypothetical protein
MGVEGEKAAKPQAAFGLDVKLDSEQLPANLESTMRLEQAAMAVCPPGANYTGSVAVHCFEQKLTREMMTVTQPHLMKMNDQVINLHMSNFAIAFKKMLTGHRPSTLDRNDKR